MFYKHKSLIFVTILINSGQIPEEGGKMNNFLCPKCHEHLRVGDHLIFRVRNSRKQSGLLLLSPQIGNYSSLKNPDFNTEPGETLEFFCPVCCSPLRSEIHPNLAYVIMEEVSGKQYDVYFSQILGEHSTYKTDGDSLHLAGEDAGRYTYFKVGEKFKKYF